MIGCRRYQIVILAFALVLGLSGEDTQAATYHVDVVRGNDAFPGSESQPFKTINRASKILRPGDTALIHEGVYHEQIMGGGSGVEGAPITYEGLDRSKVILQGSIRVKDWQKVGQVWVKTGLEPMIETERALQNLDEILAVDGLDGVFIGPADLSLALGAEPRAEPTDERVLDAVSTILARARAHEKRAGILCASPAFARQRLDDGFDLVSITPDLTMLTSSARAALAAVRRPSDSHPDGHGMPRPG